MKTDNQIGLALERDLERLRITQREFVAKITVDGQRPMSMQAFSNWKKHGRVPNGRLPKVLEVLGPDSELRSLLLNDIEGLLPQLLSHGTGLIMGRSPVRIREPSKGGGLSSLQRATLDSLEMAMAVGKFNDIQCVELLRQCVETT